MKKSINKNLITFVMVLSVLQDVQGEPGEPSDLEEASNENVTNRDDVKKQREFSRKESSPKKLSPEDGPGEDEPMNLSKENLPKELTRVWEERIPAVPDKYKDKYKASLADLDEARKTIDEMETTNQKRREEVQNSIDQQTRDLDDRIQKKRKNSAKNAIDATEIRLPDQEDAKTQLQFLVDKAHESIGRITEQCKKNTMLSPEDFDKESVKNIQREGDAFGKAVLSFEKATPGVGHILKKITGPSEDTSNAITSFDDFSHANWKNTLKKRPFCQSAGKLFRRFISLQEEVLQAIKGSEDFELLDGKQKNVSSEKLPEDKSPKKGRWASIKDFLTKKGKSLFN